MSGQVRPLVRRLEKVALCGGILALLPLYLDGASSAMVLHGASSAQWPLGEIEGVVTALFGVSATMLVLVALLRSDAERLLHALLLAVVLAFIALPSFYHYQSAVTAAPGYQIEVLTDPGLLRGVVKRAQKFLQITPCHYQLSGWSEDQVLYYQEECSPSTARIWAFAPGRDAGPREMKAAPQPLRAMGLEADVQQMVRGTGYEPGLVESTVRPLVAQGNGISSPDSRWIGLIAQHVYGPEDVIVVSRKLPGQ